MEDPIRDAVSHATEQWWHKLRQPTIIIVSNLALLGIVAGLSALVAIWQNQDINTFVSTAVALTFAAELVVAMLFTIHIQAFGPDWWRRTSK